MMLTRKRNRHYVVGAVLAAVVLIWIALAALRSGGAGGGESSAAVEQLLAYNDSIRLTGEQEAIHREALEALPAPCCDTFTAATCCCECNLARAIWGLSKHLITEGQGSAQVREQVAAWTARANPSGFTGDACFEGNCKRTFQENGCGGMDRDHLVF